MGAKPPDTPAIGMEARKGGDAAGGSVHDSPAAFGGTPACFPSMKIWRMKKGQTRV